MLTDSGAAFKKAMVEHNARPRHTTRLIAQLWLDEELEVVHVNEMSVSTSAVHAMCD